MDLDGTMLNSEKVVSPGTRAKLIEAQKRGIKVVLASGRPTNGMLHLADELEMDKYEGYIVSYNGSSVYDVKTKEVVFSQALAPELARDILRHMKDYDVVPMVDVGDTMYVTDAYFDMEFPVPAGFSSIVEYEVRGGNFKVCEVADFEDVITQPVNKILVAGNPTYLKEHNEAMKEPFLDNATAAFSAPFYFEYTDKGIDKARALAAFLPKLGIEAEHVISFGDGQNDRSIIEYAGLGVAMANAADEILAIADEITKSNDEDGIVEILNRFF